jgi:hypothetical protein
LYRLAKTGREVAYPIAICVRCVVARIPASDRAAAGNTVSLGESRSRIAVGGVAVRWRVLLNRPTGKALARLSSRQLRSIGWVRMALG